MKIVVCRVLSAPLLLAVMRRIRIHTMLNAAKRRPVYIHTKGLDQKN